MRPTTWWSCAVAVAIGVAAVNAPAPAADLTYVEFFEGDSVPSWPAPWFAGTPHVLVADVIGGRGRLRGDPMFVSRMILPGFSERDVEAEITFEFENPHAQGIGFYVRQNGGTLQEYLPHGQGYAMFLKGAWAWPEDLGLWYEADGVETQFATGYNPVPGGLLGGTRYRLRYRVTQSDPATTLLQARVWPEASPEPAAWTVESSNTRPELQGVSGSFAIDIYNHTGTGNVYLDHLVIRRYPYVAAAPRANPGSAPTLAVRPMPVTTRALLDFQLAGASAGELHVFDLAGRRVAEPIPVAAGAGTRSMTWDPVDDSGRRLAPGVYLMRLVSGTTGVIRRVVVAG